MLSKINLAINKVYKHFNNKSEPQYLIMMSKQMFNLFDCMYMGLLVDVPSICFMKVSPYTIDPIEKKLDVERRFYNKLFRELQKAVPKSTDVIPTLKERKQSRRIRQYQFYVYMSNLISKVDRCTEEQYEELKVISNKIKLWAHIDKPTVTKPL